MDIIKDTIEIKKFYVVNSRLMLSIFQKGKEHTFKTSIRDCSENELLIDPITYKGLKTRLHDKESICLSVSKLGAIWLGESQIERHQLEPVEGYWIKYPQEIMKVQRRQFLRLDSRVEVTLKYYKRGIFYTSDKVDSFDISGSGLGVRSEDPVSQTMELVVDFNYGGVLVSAQAEIVHTAYNKEAELYYTGIRFLDLDPSISDKLHKKIIEEELVRRRKGSL